MNYEALLQPEGAASVNCVTGSTGNPNALHKSSPTGSRQPPCRPPSRVSPLQSRPDKGQTRRSEARPATAASGRARAKPPAGARPPATDTGPQGPKAPTWTDSFRIMVGTSFSSPLVAGTVGLMVSAQRGPSPGARCAAKHGPALPHHWRRQRQRPHACAAMQPAQRQCETAAVLLQHQRLRRRHAGRRERRLGRGRAARRPLAEDYRTAGRGRAGTRRRWQQHPGRPRQSGATRAARARAGADQAVRLFTIDAVACNGSTSCPNATAAARSGCAEARRQVQATN